MRLFTLAHGILGALALSGGALLVWNEPPRGRVEGQILGPKLGAPIQGAHLTLLDSQGQWHRARTDERGQWALELPAGVYRMSAQSGRWQWFGKVSIQEAQTVAPPVKLRWRPPDVPATQPRRDQGAVDRRVREIVGARVFLTRATLLTIARNNQSNWPLAIVVAQAGAESSFRPELAGTLDEIGLFQLRPATAQDLARRPVTPAQLRDPALSTRLATRYLEYLERYFGERRRALAAYNQGMGRTTRDGLTPSAQVYADAILTAARNKSLREHALRLAPELRAQWNEKKDEGSVAEG